MPKGRLVDTLLRAGSRAWRGLIPLSLRRLAHPLMMAGVVDRRVERALAQPQPAPSPGPLVVSGFVSESRGVSEAMRLTLAGLRASGLSPESHDLRTVLDAGPGARAPLPLGPGGVWICHANAPEAMYALAYLDPESWLSRRRIGYWVWELGRVPETWVKASRAFHEIWAPSRFVADAMMASGVVVPVRVMPHPVALGQAVPPDRAAFDIPKDAFVVLSMGDLRSSLARKNLIGAIEIYRHAFPEVTEKRRMVVKVQSTDPHPDIDTAMALAVAGRPDITVMTETLPATGVLKLIASADVFLSPHRAEGFGLPLAEAFMAGVPALATGWSGNLDFMGDIPELLIRHRLVPVHDPFGIYKAPGRVWAEPDPADASAKLRALEASPQLRQTLAAHGRKNVEAQLAVWNVETPVKADPPPADAAT